MNDARRDRRAGRRAGIAESAGDRLRVVQQVLAGRSNSGIVAVSAQLVEEDDLPHRRDVLGRVAWTGLGPPALGALSGQDRRDRIDAHRRRSGRDHFRIARRTVEQPAQGQLPYRRRRLVQQPRQRVRPDAIDPSGHGPDRTSGLVSLQVSRPRQRPRQPSPGLRRVVRARSGPPSSKPW